MRRSVIKVGFSLIALTVSATAFAQTADLSATASAQAQVREEWVAHSDSGSAIAVDERGNVYVTGGSEGGYATR